MKKLDKVNIEDIIGLTPMQEGMLFHYLKDPESIAYFEQLNLGIEGTIDIKRFERAWNFVIETNEMLRAVFRWEKVENPTQIILKEHKLQLKYYNFSARDTSEVEARKLKMLEELKVRDRMEKFDLRKVPFRVTLCKVEEEKYEMIISNHHILYDGWSNGIILKEFFEAYNNLWSEDEFLQPPVKTKFKEFVKWFQVRDIEKEEKSWRNYLKGIDSQTGLSIKKSSQIKITGFETYRVKFDPGEKNKLEDFVRGDKRTLASVFYSAWGLLLQQYNSSEDVIFGTTVSGRNANVPGIEEMVGMFLNTLPLRIQTRPNDTTAGLLDRVQKVLQDREEFENSSLVDIKQFSDITTQEELFDSILVLENYPLAMMLDKWLLQYQAQSSLSVESYSMKEQTHYDLTVVITAFKHIEILIIYNEEVFDYTSIVNLGCHFMNITREMVTDPGGKLSDLEMLSREEKEKILYDFNNTDAGYPHDKRIHELFVQQAEQTPDHTALLGQIPNKEVPCGRILNALGGRHLTYRELNKTSHQMAGLLQEKGVKPDTIVGIMVGSSMEMVIGILGILKAGGAYLPIDTDYPGERKQYMLADSKAGILVTTPKLQVKAEVEKNFNQPLGLPIQFVNIEGGLTAAFKPSSSTLTLTSTCQVSPANLAYIIYTSGSTGGPKGVMVDHCSVVNILAALQRYYPLMETDAYLLKTSYLFDVSVTELFGWFWAGGKLVLMETTDRKDPGKILAAVERHHITHINFVPSLFSAFLELLEQQKGQTNHYLGSLKYIFLAGEALVPELVNRFQRLETGILLENLYGPTEGTIYASGYSLSQWSGESPVPIGIPLANIRLYILSKYHQWLPIGIAGELCISGKGLARGYLNRPGLTNEKFLRMFHGAVFQKSPPGRQRQKIYRTGDLARWLPDGNIEFLGRSDHQVKIRGFRVELGEIEDLLLKHEEIKDAVVNVWSGGEDGDVYLCAYIVSDKQIKISRLREYLLKELPDYMVPVYFIRMERIPLTSSGKINRKALPGPGIKVGEHYAAPGNETEKKLVDIWSGVLGRIPSRAGFLPEDLNCPKPGIDDNFFDLGGHSLKATRVASRVHKELNVIVSLQEIIKNPTIRELARTINKAKKNLYSSIQLTEKKEYYGLSPAQKRLYIVQQMEKDNISYNMPWVSVLEGQLDKHRLEAAFRELIQRHESFRTSFEMTSGEPVQRVHEEVGFEIECYDLQVAGAGDQIPNKKETEGHHSSKNRIIHHSFVRSFDLTNAPLLRVGLVNLEKTKHILMVDMHHIISDGVSTEVFIRDFTVLYSYLYSNWDSYSYTGNRDVLPRLGLQYKDYWEWQRRRSDKEKTALKQQEGYWLKEFAGDIPLLNLPTDYPRPVIRSLEGRAWSFEVGIGDTIALKKLADQGVTLYMVLLAAYTIFLSKISNQEDIIVGSPMAGRRHGELENLIGMFVNTLAMRNFPAAGKTFGKFLREVKERTLTAFANQDYPYEELVEQLRVNRDTGRNPLFDIFFALQNLDIPGVEIPGLKVKPYDFDSIMRTSKFDLSLNAAESAQGLRFTFEYRTDLFREKTISRFAGCFKRVIAAVTQDSQVKLWQIHIISEEERNMILFDFNRTDVPYPGDKSIHRLFEEQMERTPDQVALVAQGARRRAQDENGHYALDAMRCAITYNELNEKSNQLAHLLVEKGVKPYTIVGIMVERSVEMIIGLLGILKAGGAYLPLDPDYPEERIDYMLKDSGAKILLTAPLIQVEISSLTLTSTLTCQVSSANLAYIIYTSGSTGKPKGVMIEHRNVIRLVKNSNYIDFEEADRLLPTGAFAFDITTFEIWGPLLNGVTIYMVPEDIIPIAESLGKVMKENNITILHLTPQLFNQLAARDPGIFADLRILLVGGDLVRPRYVNLLRNKSKDLNVLHMYGPTENTTFSTFFPVDKDYDTTIPIGKPISNTRVYILDKHLRLQPIGVVGELCVGGAGVARGYLNNPELTAEKFDHDFWDYQDDQDEEKKDTSKKYNKKFFADVSRGPGGTRGLTPLLYRTGDLARWLVKGNIQFLGRLDNQVKIRGYRVEPGEIENKLLQHESAAETLVTTTPEGDLCAFIVSSLEKEEFNMTELREYLAKELPPYMIPSYFVKMEKIPLTPGGKIDRRVLPVPAPGINKAKDYLAPRDETEEKMVKVWDEVLKVGEENISIDADFFELGGHSLKATIIISLIHKVFNLRLTLSEMFRQPTVRQLSGCVKESVKDQYKAVETAEEKEYYPLSSPQGRLYILQQFKEDDMTYHMPGVMILEGEPKVDRLEATFCRMIERHESLRTSFVMVGGEPVQKIHEEVEFEIEYYGTHETHEKHEKNEEIIKDFIRPFDLSKAPLLRVGLINLEKTKHILMIDMHHIISDGTSVGIFIKEFMALYHGEELLPVLVQYKDFSEWQSSERGKQLINQQEHYWLQQFSREIPVLELPYNFSRPLERSFEGSSVSFKIGIEEIAALKQLAIEENVTMFMLLMAVYKVLLSKLSWSEDIVVGTPVLGRVKAEFQHIIGMFVNTLAIRSQPSREKTFHEFLKEIKEITSGAFENQAYPFENLVERVAADRDASHHPLFDTMFTLQNIDIPEKEIPGLKLKPYEYNHPVSRFDMTWNGEEGEKKDTLCFTVEYNTSLFKGERINRFAHYFKEIIKIVLVNRDIRLKDIELSFGLSDSRKKMVEEASGEFGF